MVSPCNSLCYHILPSLPNIIGRSGNSSCQQAEVTAQLSVFDRIILGKEEKVGSFENSLAFFKAHILHFTSCHLITHEVCFIQETFFMSLYPSELSEKHGQEQLSGLALLRIEHDISFKLRGGTLSRMDDFNFFETDHRTVLFH